jgi:DNA repair exonuclease SbcCD ATPase subunit
VAERLDAKVDEVFGPENGHVTRVLAKHFGDESSVAVQNRVRSLLAEVGVQMREDLRKQFSSDSESNPLAGFQRASLAVIKQTSDQQAEHLRAMTEKLEALKVEMAELKAEKERLAVVAAVEEKGTAKGRTYEDAVFEAVDTIAVARGDDCDAVGDVRGEGGKKGDVVVSIDACAGPARGRIVFEAKDRKLSKNAALEELDRAIETRGADYGVLVVPSEDELPARTHPLREFNGNKLFVVHDPNDGSRLALDVAYGLARARVLMARSEVGGLDAAALRVEVERAGQAMEDVRRIKSQLTNATNGIEQARAFVDAMAATVRQHLAAIDSLIDAATPGDAAS